MNENLLFGFSVAIVGALVAILIAVSIAATRILAAMRKGRMLSACHGYGSEAMSQTGVSVVVSGAQSEREIEERLSSEYWRYEVIVVLDSTRDGRLLSRLCRKYSMIRVSFPTDGDLKIDGVPLLYRSPYHADAQYHKVLRHPQKQQPAPQEQERGRGTA